MFKSQLWIDISHVPFQPLPNGTVIAFPLTSNPPPPTMSTTISCFCEAPELIASITSWSFNLKSGTVSKVTLIGVVIYCPVFWSKNALRSGDVNVVSISPGVPSALRSARLVFFISSLGAVLGPFLMTVICSCIIGPTDTYGVEEVSSGFGT